MISLDKRDSSVTIFEREEFLKKVYSELPDHSVLLNTCDRVEVYYDDPGTEFSENELYKTVHHLYRVTAGLESPLLGENQIMHQVKAAYNNSVSDGLVSKNLHLLFQSAFQAGKHARSVTGIGIGAMSHSQAVVDILRKRFPDLQKKTIALIGVNNLNKKILQYLKKESASIIFLGNRTYNKALILSKEFSCEAFNLSDIKTVLQHSDILISATSAPHIIVKLEDYPVNKCMFIIDLAVPRDIDPNIAGKNGTVLLNVKDIEDQLNNNMSIRSMEALQAEILIKDAAVRFIDKYKKLQSLESCSVRLR